MQLLQSRPDGRHLCLLDDVELALLVQADSERSGRAAFLRELYALPLDEATANVVARDLERYPHLFQNEQGVPMTLETWAHAVVDGGWSAPNLGPVRLRKIAEALDKAKVVAAKRQRKCQGCPPKADR